MSTVTLGSKRSGKTFQVDSTMCKAGSEEAIGMAGGSDPQGHVLLWKRGEEVIVVMKAGKNLASVFLSARWGIRMPTLPAWPWRHILQREAPAVNLIRDLEAASRAHPPHALRNSTSKGWPFLQDRARLLSLACRVPVLVLTGNDAPPPHCPSALGSFCPGGLCALPGVLFHLGGTEFGQRPRRV